MSPTCPKCGHVFGEDAQEELFITEPARIGIRITPADLATAWNELNGKLPGVRELSPARQAKCKLRLRNKRFLEKFREAIIIANNTPFLTGDNSWGWRANFDWFTNNDENVDKVLSGMYLRANSGTRATPKAFEQTHLTEKSVKLKVSKK